MNTPPEMQRGPPCDCPPGQCAHFVDPDTHCIGRLTGDVVTKACAACGPGVSTWHHNGQCLPCQIKEKEHNP